MVSIQVGAVCPLDAWRSRPRGRRCPPLPLGVLPPMAAALLRYARGGQHSRPPHRLSACSAARPARVGGQITRGGAEKPARPSRRLRCAPPRGLACRPRAAAAAGGHFEKLPPLEFLVVVAVGSSVATPPPRCPSPVALWPAKVGGACLPCGRLKPPPLLRPRPPINVWGRGLSHCPAGVSPLRRGRCCACAALRHNILCPSGTRP